MAGNTPKKEYQNEGPDDGTYYLEFDPDRTGLFAKSSVGLTQEIARTNAHRLIPNKSTKDPRAEETRRVLQNASRRDRKPHKGYRR